MTGKGFTRWQGGHGTRAERGGLDGFATRPPYGSLRKFFSQAKNEATSSRYFLPDATGQVSFAGLPPGTYAVRLAPQQDFPVQLPDSSPNSVTVQVGREATVAAGGFGLIPVNAAVALGSSQNLHPSNPTASSTAVFVEGLYHNILGRASDPGGLAFWSSQLAPGTPAAQIV